MQYFLVIVICVIVIPAVVVVVVRKYLKRESKKLSDELNHLPPYKDIGDRTLATECLPEFYPAVDIQSDLNNCFRGEIISATQKKNFIDYYAPYYEAAHSLFGKCKAFGVTQIETILNLVSDFENIDSFVKRHNEEVVDFLLETHKDFFDHCLKYPLDSQQRRSIVSEEDNCLVVSSAGSGKTSSIIGKVKYLTEVKGIDPRRILLISYTNKAAAELTERLDTDGLRGYTFHKLAIDMIGRVTGEKPSICDNTDALFVEIYHALLKEKRFRKSIVEYLVDYKVGEDDEERRKNERREQLSEQKKTRLKAMFPDMDGRTVYVRSEQEQKICFVLYSLGVKFRYEEPYEHQLADEMHSQYCPDFSIYFEQDGVTRRIYLEHFGVDEHSLVPAWFAEDKGMTYEEANKKYNDGITWKKSAHDKFDTTLLVTSSADFFYSDIKAKLKRMLADEGVPIREKPDDELYNSVLPKGSKQEKAFIRLAVTFVTLVKSSCKSIQEVLRQAMGANDVRSAFVIKNIFMPVYTQYIKALNDMGRIDFTDAILQATEICRASHPLEYDYIIVDEFQDISVDRYNFLKALREGSKPAKLYCVGDDWQSIYRFSGSDMSLFNQFPDYFGTTEINKIETTYRFGEPLVSLSSGFIQRNGAQIKKDVHPFRPDAKTELEFLSYGYQDYCNTVGALVASIPTDKSIFLLGRYSFDDYYVSSVYQGVKEGNRFYYLIGERKIEFLTVHKSKGLEADYVILLRCNKDIHGFPSLVSDDPVLNYVLTKSDRYPYGEERRLFYVAITRAKLKTFVLYDKRFPSVFVNEFLHPEVVSEESYVKHPNANKIWTKRADNFLLTLYGNGMSVKCIAQKMGRSQTSIVMRLNKLNKISG